MKFKKIISTIITATMLATTIVSLAEPFQKIVFAADLSSKYDGDDLGCTYTKEKTTFKVWAPTASKVVVNRYEKGNGGSSLGQVEMKQSSDGVWTAEVSGDIKDTYYTYGVTVNGKTNETQDVYSKSTGVNGARSMVIDLDSTDPDGWENDKRIDSPNQTDAVVWEIHVKDFSYDENSGISKENRGKYLAFTEQGTKYTGTDISTGIDHLKELGITHVQIMPMYDYGSIDETSSEDKFNWGYDPVNFNTPEGSYSSNPYDGNSRVKELKEMVKALHDAGIGVIMDVVYNHAFDLESSPFEKTVPGYYFRPETNDGKGNDTSWSGCGNAFDTKKAMYSKYVKDSMKYWAEEYHLDGFRFDLMGIIDVDTLNGVRKELNSVDPQIKIWGEPWVAAGGGAGYGNKDGVKSLDNNIGVFNDNMRDAIKGKDFNGWYPGWVANDSTSVANDKNIVIAGIKTKCGSYDDINKDVWSKQPSQVVNYTSCHDNRTLYDNLARNMGIDVSCDNGNYKFDGKYNKNLDSLNRLSAALVLTSHGVSFMQAGEEFARTKYGEHNSYNKSPDLNKLDWGRLKDFAGLNDYYAGLIKIRNNFSAFRDPTNASLDKLSFVNNLPNSQIAFTQENSKSGEWKKLFCAFNSDYQDATISLPSGDWVVIANDEKAGVTSLGEKSGQVTLKGRSAMILVDKSSFDSTVIGSNGTVKIKCVDEDGKDIVKETTKSGKQGTSFEITAPELDGYALVDSSKSVQKGTYDAKEQTVTFTYKKDSTPKGTVTVKCIDVETNKEIQADTVTTKKVGESYKITTPEISGYTVDDTYMPKNAEGTYSDKNIDVTYYYLKSSEKPVSDKITIHYYNANDWADPYIYAYTGEGETATQYSGKWPGAKMEKDKEEGWYTYTVDSKSASVIFNDGAPTNAKQEPAQKLPGYECEAGDVSIKDKVVTKNEIPTEPDRYIVRSIYIDEDTNEEIEDSTVKILKADEEYTTEDLDIDGYTIGEEPANAAGTVKDKNILVTYEYAKSGDPIETKGKVIVSYVDEDENVIKKSTSITGVVGKSYTIVPADIDGYTLKEMPENSDGVFTKEDIEVTLVYTKDQVTEPKNGKVTIKYLDVDTQEEIADSKVIEGEIGKAYTTSEITIDGYTLEAAPDNAEGTYQDKKQTVIYYYAKNAVNPTDPKPTDPKPSDPTPGKPGIPDGEDETEPGNENPGEQNPGEQNPGSGTPGTEKPGETKPGDTSDASSVIMMIMIMTVAVVVLKKYSAKNN